MRHISHSKAKKKDSFIYLSSVRYLLSYTTEQIWLGPSKSEKMCFGIKKKTTTNRPYLAYVHGKRSNNGFLSHCGAG